MVRDETTVAAPPLAVLEYRLMAGVGPTKPATGSKV